MTKQQGPLAWIFLSIARSDGATLRDFFAAADHINVAIPTDQEIEDAVNHLRSCGLIDITTSGFSLTAKGRELFERVGGLSGYPRPQVGMIEPILKEIIGAATLTSEWHVDPNETAAALGQYHKDAKKALAAVMGKKRR